MGHDGGDARQAGQDRDPGRPGHPRPGQHVPHDRPTRALADFTRTVELMETVARVETAIARTLQHLAESTPEGSPATARRMKLSGEALQGAHTALAHAAHLREQTDHWAQRNGDDTRMLRRPLTQAANILTKLASTDEQLAVTFTRLAQAGRQDLADRRRLLAEEARAGARHARAHARALQELAGAPPAPTDHK